MFLLTFPYGILDIVVWAHSRNRSREGGHYRVCFRAPWELCCTVTRGHAQKLIAVKEVTIAF